MKKLLTILFSLLLLVGCAKVEYSTSDLNLEVGLTKEELTSKIKDTIKANDEKATDEQLEKLEISFDEAKLNQLGEFEATIKVEDQELKSKITLKDTTKPTIKTEPSVKVKYNTKIDKNKLIELLKIELSDNHTDKEKLLENFSFTKYDQKKAGKQEITLSLKDASNNETTQTIVIEVGKKPAPKKDNVVNNTPSNNNTINNSSNNNSNKPSNNQTSTPSSKPEEKDYRKNKDLPPDAIWDPVNGHVRFNYYPTMEAAKAAGDSMVFNEYSGKMADQYFVAETGLNDSSYGTVYALSVMTENGTYYLNSSYQWVTY